MAISGWRRLAFFSDCVDCLSAEGKYPHLKTDGDKLMQGLKDEQLHDDSINETTQKRYLSLGKRVHLHQKVLMKWEMFHQRETLIDSQSTLRNVFSISEREDDIAYILNELCMQQRAGIRTSLMTAKSKNEVCLSFFFLFYFLYFFFVFLFLGQDTSKCWQMHADQTHGAEPLV